MRPDDVPAADGILRASFGDFSHVARIDALLRQRATHSLVAECDGRAAGVAFGNDYVSVGYVSLMGVAPDFRLRGLASLLMAELIAWSESRAFADLGLDATEAGEAVYDRFGFVEVAQTLVFARAGAGAGPAVEVEVRPVLAADAAAVRALDERAFGADRSALLEILLAERTVLFADGERGYAVLSAAENGAVIGPWIARDAEAGRALLAAGMARLPGEAQLRLFVPSNNALAIQLAGEAGFERQRALRHMIRGVPNVPRATLYGRANLGQG